MNYRRIYDQLIEHAQGSPRPQETGEEHHIVPKCMGGSDEKSNKVYLSTHEHIWAHIWLAQIYPDVFGLQLAVSWMVFGDNESLGRFPTSEQIRDSGEARERYRRLQSERMKGKSLSEETRQKISENNGMLGKSHSEEAKRKISDAQSGEKSYWFGKNHSEEAKRKISENHRMRGKLPWLHYNTLRSPKSLQVWCNADDYFKLWKKHRCADAKLAKLFGVSVSKTHRSLVKKFRAGWVPDQDSEWLTFKENSNGN